MGFIKKIFGCIIFFVFVYAFFAFGGYTFLKDKYDLYTSPEREVFIEEERDFGNLENISPDYILSRSLNFFGFRKLNAYYVPKRQRITVLDLNSDKIVTEEDFENGKIKTKLEDFMGGLVHSPIVPVSNIEIVKIGKIKAGKKEIPYANFEANVKMIPFFKAKGTVALYQTKNRENLINKIKKDTIITPKLVISAKFPTGYDEKITKKFVSEIKF